MEKNIGFFSFHDPYAWMESMKGDKWNKAIEEQKKRYHHYLKNHVKTQDLKDLEEEFSSHEDHVPNVYIMGYEVEMIGFNRLLWNVIGEKKKNICADLDIADTHKLWQVRDTSQGAEEYTLEHVILDKTVWSYDKIVAPYVAVIQGRCYVLEQESDLWYNKLVSLDAHSGLNRKVLLELDDPEWNLEMIKGCNLCLFIRGNNAGHQRLWYLTREGKIQEITGEATAFVPVGFNSEIDTKPLYFALVDGTYKPFHFPSPSTFPNLKEYIPETYFPKDEMLVTRHYGLRTVWALDTGKELTKTVGNIDPHPLVYWIFGISNEAVLTRPEFDRSLLVEPNVRKAYAYIHYTMTKSKDGTKVPYIMVMNPHPTKLLCVAYGAYGIPTMLSTQRWKPFLKRGWALCIALVRGGGDHDDAWAEAARAAHKTRSVEDFEACIAAAQRTVNIGAKKTVIYGRSAGGYLVGACLARHPSGKLFRGVYTEVPYVDVLSTAANPGLPLTRLEYHEFGNPRQNLADAQTMVQLSPVHALPPQGAPGVFVLDRIGLKDKEVFAYESLKWINRLQEQKGLPKLLAISEDEGHFASEEKKGKERAMDFLVLESFMKG